MRTHPSRSLRSPARAAALCAVLGAAASACLDPTEAIVDIKTDSACASVRGTGIAAGKDANVETDTFGTTTDQCSDGEIGSIVLFPDGERDGPLLFKVVTSLAPAEVESCVPPYYGPNCIVARRSMSFVPHHPYHVPVSMRTACAGVLCPVDQTCVEGTCVSSTIDPEDCDQPGGCDPKPDPIPPWEKHFGGAGSQMARHLARGADSTLLVTGNFDPTLDLGAGPLKSKGSNDIFVASFAPTGEARWARSFGGSGDDEGLSVAVSQQGDVLALGVFQEDVDLGSGAVTSRGDWDVVLLKLDAAGDVAWAKTIGSTGVDTGGKVALDESGNVYVAGSFTEEMNLLGTKLTPAGDTDAFVASFTPDGDLRWAKGFGASKYDAANAVAISGAGQVFVGGTFQGSMKVGSTTLDSAGAGDAFVASLDNEGNVLWAKAFGSLGQDLVLDLAARGDRIVATGALAGAAQLDGEMIGTSNEDDGFVIAFDPGGTPLWSRTFGGEGADQGTTVDVAYDGSVFLGGSVSAGPAFEGPAVMTDGVRHPFAAVLEPSGEPRWIRQLTSSNWGDATGIVASPDGYAIFASWFTGSLTIDEKKDPFVSEDAEDMLLMRIAPP